MRFRTSSQPHFLLALSALIAFGFAACSSPSTSRKAPTLRNTTIDEIAEELLEVTEQRAALRAVRLHLRDIHALTGSRIKAVNSSSHDEDLMATELEHRFLIALSRRFATVEPEFFQPDSVQAPDSGLETISNEYAITHVVVGDYEYAEGTLNVRLRLVNVKTLLIVAASRGSLSLAEFSDQAVSYLTDPHDEENEVEKAQLAEAPAEVPEEAVAAVPLAAEAAPAIEEPPVVTKAISFEEWLEETRAAQAANSRPAPVSKPKLAPIQSSGETAIEQGQVLRGLPTGNGPAARRLRRQPRTPTSLKATEKAKPQ